MSWMCQLLAVSTAAAVRTRLSWDGFAMRGSEATGNLDGWGVAYADGKDVHLSREPSPAADSPLVKFLGSHGPASTTLISHIRRATIGNRVLANTQPFVRALGGRMHIFAHNGHVTALEAPSEPWLRTIGTTDSENMFSMLLHRLEPLWRATNAPELGPRSDIVTRFAEEMRRHGAANFLYFDGLTLFAHGHRRTIPGAAISQGPGLFLLLRAEESGPPIHTPCQGLESIGPGGAQALVATIPLDEQRWRPLAEGEMLRIERGALV